MSAGMVGRRWWLAFKYERQGRSLSSIVRMMSVCGASLDEIAAYVLGAIRR